MGRPFYSFVKFALIATVFGSLSLTTSLAATLKGKVTAVIGNDITIQLDGTLEPRPGDLVEVVFKTPDGDEVPVGTWTVSRVDGNKVRAKKKEAFGTAEVGYAATIESSQPVGPRAAQTDSQGDTAKTLPKEPMRASIGVRIKDAETEYGVKGALVIAVTRGGPAATAGIRTGDIIVDYNGGRIETWQDLPKRVQAGRPDDPVLVTLLRGGERRQLIIVPEARSLAAIRQPPDADQMRELLDQHYQSARAFYFGRSRTKDYAKAYKMFLEAASDGHLNSMVMVGVMHEHGKHVTASKTAAVSWYRKAADAGSAWGQTNLGVMYEYGNGVKRNYAEAARLYRKAADQNHRRGQAFLGELYEYGHGVKKDYREAARLYEKSAAQDYRRGIVNLAELYEAGKGVRRDYAKAAELYKRAANKDSRTAHYRLGRMYHKGRGVPRSFEKAAEHYRRAASKGHTNAQVGYGHMLMNGYGVKRDDHAAARWFRKAAKKGNAGAMFNMGYLYSVGQLGPRDLKSAEQWFTAAERKSSRYSLYAIAQAFERNNNQLGLPKNDSLARHFYRRAADRGDSRARRRLSELEGDSGSYSTDE